MIWAAWGSFLIHFWFWCQLCTESAQRTQAQRWVCAPQQLNVWVQAFILQLKERWCTMRSTLWLENEIFCYVVMFTKNCLWSRACRARHVWECSRYQRWLRAWCRADNDYESVSSTGSVTIWTSTWHFLGCGDGFNEGTKGCSVCRCY